MSAIKEHIALLQYRVKNHAHQTDGFTWDYTNATDDDVFDTTLVFQETIDGLSNIILKIIKPQERPKIRREIAYLIGLRDRQGEVWSKYLADCEARANNTNQWVQQFQQ